MNSWLHEPKQDSDQETTTAKEQKGGPAEVIVLREDVDLAKVEVIKEAISLLRERGVRSQKGELRRECERFATLFEAMKQRLEA